MQCASPTHDSRDKQCKHVAATLTHLHVGILSAFTQSGELVPVSTHAVIFPYQLGTTRSFKWVHKFGDYA